MNEPRPCVRCHMKTILTCAQCLNALCSYCQEENRLCPRCRAGIRHAAPNSGIAFYGLTFARLAEEGGGMMRDRNRCPPHWP